MIRQELERLKSRAVELSSEAQCLQSMADELKRESERTRMRTEQLLRSPYRSGAARNRRELWATCLAILLVAELSLPEIRVALALLVGRLREEPERPALDAFLAGMRIEHYYRARKSLRSKFDVDVWLRDLCDRGGPA